jgi:hypothetical protein
MGEVPRRKSQGQWSIGAWHNNLYNLTGGLRLKIDYRPRSPTHHLLCFRYAAIVAAN